MDYLISQFFPDEKFSQKKYEKAEKATEIETDQRKSNTSLKIEEQMQLITIENERLRNIIETSHKQLPLFNSNKNLYFLEKKPKSSNSTSSNTKVDKFEKKKDRNFHLSNVNNPEFVSATKHLKKKSSEKISFFEERPITSEKRASKIINNEIVLKNQIKKFSNEDNTSIREILQHTERNNQTDKKLQSISEEAERAIISNKMKDKPRKFSLINFVKSSNTEQKRAISSFKDNQIRKFLLSSANKASNIHTIRSTGKNNQRCATETIYKPLTKQLFSRLDAAQDKNIELVIKNEKYRVHLQRSQTVLEDQKKSIENLRCELNNYKSSEKRSIHECCFEESASHIRAAKAENFRNLKFEIETLEQHNSEFEDKIEEIRKSFKEKVFPFQVNTVKVGEKEINEIIQELSETKDKLRIFKSKFAVLSEENIAIKEELLKELKIRKTIETEVKNKINRFEEKYDLFKSFELELKEGRAKTVRYTFVN